MTQDEFGAITLYNPQLLTPDELRRNFVVRREELTRLLEELSARANATPQHHLVLAQQGMGKTTLLHGLAHEVEADAELAAAYIPLLFPEEQYNIRNLGDLWVNCLDALAEALERMGDSDGAAEVDELVRGLPRGEELEDAARDALLEQARSRGRKLLLLLDNADMVFSRIEGGDWSLRRALQAHPELVVIGASATSMESTYKYDAAFFDFFATMRLDGLGPEEAVALVLRLADDQEQPDVRRMVEEHPERVEPIRLLCGGNPRTLVALFEVMIDDSGSVSTDLSVLLDRYTPHYKARFDSLSPQAQTIVDALCLHWDPATAAALAERTGHGVNTVSSQLDRLVGAGLVEKHSAIDPVTGERRRRNAFQIAERFFNIWYLVRSSRRERRRLRAFVRVLEAMHTKTPVADVPTLDDALQRLDDDAILHDFITGTLAGLLADGAASVARDRIDEAGEGHRLRPVREALHAAAIGEPRVLGALAPEVAEAAAELLEMWAR